MIIMENQTKICTGKCGQTKPLSEFNKDSQNADGLRMYCRECQQGYKTKYLTTPIGKAKAALLTAQYSRRRAEAKLGITIADDLKSYHIAMVQGEDECIYCRKELTPSTVTIDHAFTFAQGGTNEYKNILPACFSCNSRKGAKPILQFLAEHCTEKQTQQVIFRLAQRRGIEYAEMYEQLQTPEQSEAT